MKTLTKYLGIAGLTALSFLPLKNNVYGQDVLTGYYTPTDYSKLSETQRDSFCFSLYRDIDSLQNEIISLYSQANSYRKNIKDQKFIEKADSLEKDAGFYKKLQYNWYKREANKVCSFSLKEE